MKYRNEWKYCCTARDLGIIDNRLAALLEKDSHGDSYGRYEIHSLYFDDCKDSGVKENEAGIARRFKYRIRYYDTQHQVLRLECKQKLYERCYKESCPLTLEEYQKIASGDVEELFWQTDKPLLRQFCIRCMTRHFTPKAIIDYKRTAYTEEITNMRITLDENISVSNEFESFLNGDYMRYPIMRAGQHVLEVKFDYMMPGYIRHIITNRNLVQSSISKYCMGRRVLQSLGQNTGA